MRGEWLDARPQLDARDVKRKQENKAKRGEARLDRVQPAHEDARRGPERPQDRRPHELLNEGGLRVAVRVPRDGRRSRRSRRRRRGGERRRLGCCGALAARERKERRGGSHPLVQALLAG